MSRAGESLPAAQIIELLEEGPTRISEITASVPAAVLKATDGTAEWSAGDVLAHLRSCADVWGDCIATILARRSPTIRATNPRAWIERTNYRGLEFRRSLQAFAAQRRALVAVLRSLPPRAWSRSATVTGAGKPLTRTVLSYAEWMATHERPHIKQIQRCICPS